MKIINKTSLEIKESVIKFFYVLLIMSLSIVETIIFFSLSKFALKINKDGDLFLLAIPIILMLICAWISSKEIFSHKKIEYQNFVQYLKSASIVSIFIYLMIILTSFSISSKNKLIIILLICFGIIYLSNSIIKLKIQNHVEEMNIISTTEIKNKLFNTYYINISKVFEISMLINNEIAITVQREKTSENFEEYNENLNANINLEYLNSIKSSITFDDSYNKKNSEINRVLENFDIKTTKSNLLDGLIKKCKVYEANCNINIGDLVLFNNVKIELLNQEETMQTTKMLLNGALNGSNFSSTSNDMKMDFNMSSLTNSLLKDCCYELKCIDSDFNFVIKIPMSFENDFESSYNIYDLLIGNMTVIGIYRGWDKMKKYRSAFDFFNNNQTAQSQPFVPGLNRSVNNENSTTLESIDNIMNQEVCNYVDIIAIIQNINININ